MKTFPLVQLLICLIWSLSLSAESITLQLLEEQLVDSGGLTAAEASGVTDQARGRQTVCNNPGKVVPCPSGGCADPNDALVHSTKQPVSWNHRDEACSECFVEQSGSLIDNMRFHHVHTATDFRLDGAGGCGPCGVPGAETGSLPTVVISRWHRYRDSHRIGSMGPSVFMTFDAQITLYRLEGGTQSKARFFQPSMPLELVAKSDVGAANLTDRRFRSFRGITLASGLDAQGDPIPEVDVALATHAVLTFHDGTRWTFEVIRVGAVGTDTYEARLVRIANLNDQAITIAYAFARDADDATLNYNRQNLWRLTQHHRCPQPSDQRQLSSHHQLCQSTSGADLDGTSER